MSNPFTVHRWSTNPWKLYQLCFLIWASIWQIHDTIGTTERAGLSIANLGGSGIVLLALHLRDQTLSRNVERWAYLPLIWSMSCYLALALHYEGWWGLVHQDNLGIVLPQAIVLGSAHRVIWLTLRKRLRRNRDHRQAKRVIRNLAADVRNGGWPTDRDS